MTDYFSAKHYAIKSQKWATGTMAECPDGSAKHWAEVAEATAGLIGDPANRDLSNLTDEGLSRLSNLPLFMSFKTGHILNNASYVNGRLFSWLSGTVYTSAYQELLKEMTGSASGQITRQTLYAWADSDCVIYTNTTTPVSDADLRNADGSVYVFDGTYPKYYVEDGVVYGYLNAKSEGLGEGLSIVRSQSLDKTVVETIAEQKTQTIAGVSITYYLTGTNKKICLSDQADSVAAIYTATGAADFYLLDTENGQFKLPRRHARRLLRSYKEGTAGYNLYSDGWCEQQGIKTFKTGETLNAQVVTLPLSFADTNYMVDGLRVENADSLAYSYIKSKSTDSFILYGQGGGNAFNWVAQGYAVTTLLEDEFEYEYYFIGNTIQNVTMIDVGQISTSLTGKADGDLSNANPSQTFTSQSSGWALPGGQYVDMTLGATGKTYTAPANGWFCIVKATSSVGTQYFIMDNQTKGYTMNLTPTAGNSVRYIFPVSKGDVVLISYTASGATSYFRFIYAQGEI